MFESKAAAISLLSSFESAIGMVALPDGIEFRFLAVTHAVSLRACVAVQSVLLWRRKLTACVTSLEMTKLISWVLQPRYVYVN